MDRGARRATVHGVAEESDTTERLIETLSLSCRLAESQLWQGWAVLSL